VKESQISISQATQTKKFSQANGAENKDMSSKRPLTSSYSINMLKSPSKAIRGSESIYTISDNFNSLNITLLKSKLPSWGGSYRETINGKSRKVSIINTVPLFTS
jgi:hypothetical protein